MGWLKKGAVSLALAVLVLLPSDAHADQVGVDSWEALSPAINGLSLAIDRRTDADEKFRAYCVTYAILILFGIVAMYNRPRVP